MGDAARHDHVMETIREVVPRIVVPGAGTPDTLTESTRLMEDLGLTSASTLELILELEDALEIQIDVEEIEPADLASLGALADFITGHVVVAD